MSGVNILVMSMRHIGKSRGVSVSKILPHLVKSRTVVAFETQQIVSTRLNDVGGNGLLAAHRIQCHQATG